MYGQRSAATARRSGTLQHRILAKDGCLEGDEIGTRLQTELFDKHPPGLAEGTQGVGLVPAPVVGERQQRPATLTQRLLGCSLPGEADDLAMLARRQTRLEQVLFGRTPQLLQTARLVASRHPAVELLERAPPPQLQRPGQRRRGAISLTGRSERPPALDHRLELSNVEIDVSGQTVGAINGFDRVGAERLAQLPDAVLHLLGPRPGRIVAPHRVGDLVRLDQAPTPHHEGGQDRLRARSKRL